MGGVAAGIARSESLPRSVERTERTALGCVAR
jgi:hypothetical protein